jgi:hypothetical protein
MGKKSRQRTRTDAPPAEGAVGPRQPCPCGSGRRYKACHGASGEAPPRFVARPFAGLAGETDLVAMREFVPSASTPLTLSGSDRAVLLCSLLPGEAPALVREDGTVWLGLQVQHSYGDPSRDLAAVLTRALDAEPGGAVGLPEAPGDGPRLQDLVSDDPLEVTVHRGFDFWVADLDDSDGTMADALEQANGAAAPTERLTSATAAYWTAVGNREYLRWVLPDDEDRVLDAFARLHATGEDHLVEGDRLIGMFRAHGLVTPVWDLPLGTGAEALQEPASRVHGALRAALDSTVPLTSEERSARAGLASRQLTIR